MPLLGAHAQTVLGPIAASDLGMTMMHEHVVPRSQVPTPPGKPAYAPRVTLDDVIHELSHAAKTYGLRSAVDCTPRRSPAELEEVARVARDSGINVVVATGCMKEQYYHSARGTVSNFWAYQLSANQIADVLIREIEQGINGTSVRARIIKVGTSKDRITGHEERVLRGAARAHRATGAPITTHATLGTMGPQQAEIFLEEDVDPARVVVGHSDLNSVTAYHEGILRRGFNVGFDTIGKERFDYTRPESAGVQRYEFEKEQYFISDETRMATLLQLVRLGHAGQIVLSSDLGEMDQNPATLAAWGYSYLPGSFLPAAQDRGLSEADIQTMLVDNPRRILGGG
jgi:predicted metal-dependent phosphotriesterase family hydrolase